MLGDFERQFYFVYKDILNSGVSEFEGAEFEQICLPLATINVDVAKDFPMLRSFQIDSNKIVAQITHWCDELTLKNTTSNDVVSNIEEAINILGGNASCIYQVKIDTAYVSFSIIAGVLYTNVQISSVNLFDDFLYTVAKIALLQCILASKLKIIPGKMLISMLGVFILKNDNAKILHWLDNYQVLETASHIVKSYAFKNSIIHDYKERFYPQATFQEFIEFIYNILYTKLEIQNSDFGKYSIAKYASIDDFEYYLVSKNVNKQIDVEQLSAKIINSLED